MTEGQKKGLVVAVAALVFVPLVAWRSWRAAQTTEATGDWERYIKEERLAQAPSWFRAREVFVMHHEPEGPHLRLATLRFQQNREYLTTSLAKDANLNFPPLYRRMVEMGANASRNEQIDDQVPGLDEGVAELVQGVFLLHAGRVPGDVAAKAHRVLCQATDIIAGSAAEAAGMRAGDDFLEIGGATVYETDEPCEQVVTRMEAAPGTRVPLVMLRDGERVELELVKRAEVDGFYYDRVPILD